MSRAPERPDNGSLSEGEPGGSRVEMLGILVVLGIGLFIVFFGSLLLLVLAAAAGSWGLGPVDAALGGAADVGLVLALGMAAALLVGAVVWFGVTLLRIARGVIGKT